MEPSPPALIRSPSTPTESYSSSERSSLGYASPDLAVQQYRLSTVYAEPTCSVTHLMDHGNPLPPLETMGSATWGHAAVIPHHASSANPVSSILATEYDAYHGYEPAVNVSYTSHDVYHTQISHAHHDATPPPTARSPTSQPRSGLTYQPSTPGSASIGPRIKLEGAGDYCQPLEVAHYPSPRSIHAQYGTDTNSYTSTGAGYVSDGGSSGWQKADYPPSADSEPFYGSATQSAGFMNDSRRQQYRTARPRRTPRRLTTKEEANFQCEVKGCGKLFSRSYNFKAHMETHDENREYHFPCTIADCARRFVRKTDLQRHHQSVHMKERNHKCDYCNRLFARKDTLRRHMEDGCSKRFDIGTLDLRSEGYDGRSMAASLSHMVTAPTGSLPPMMPIPPLGSNSLSGSASARNDAPITAASWTR